MTSTTYTAKTHISAEHPDLEGHFPGMPVFPAVSQIELIINILERELHRPVQLKCVKRAKFKAILRPNTSIEINIVTIGAGEFRWTLRDETQVYSMGDMSVHGLDA